MAQMEKVQHELQKKKMFRNQEEINEQRTRIMEFMVKTVKEKQNCHGFNYNRRVSTLRSTRTYPS